MTDPDRNNWSNDARLITPLLIMALIVVCGFLYFAFLGATPPAS
jgi:Tfp pilus assembly protein PilO